MKWADKKGVNVMDDQNNPTGGIPDPNAGGVPPQDPGIGGVTPPPADPGVGQAVPTETPVVDPNQGWTPPPAPSTPPVVDPSAGVPAPEPAQGGTDQGTGQGVV